MAHIITGNDEAFGKWAAAQIKLIGTPDKFGKYRAIGVATGTNVDDKLMAVAVFHEYIPEYGTCQISFASADPRWASRQTVRAILGVPFLQYNVNKVWMAVPHTNEKMIKIAKAFGFVQEAVLASHFGPKINAVILRMFSTGYERIYWKDKPVQARAA